MKMISNNLKWALSLFSFTLITSAFAQVDINESYRHDIMEGIGHSDNLLYTFNAIPKEYRKQDLTLYNAFGKKLKTTFLESKQGLALMNCVSLGSNTLFYFDYNLSKNILFIVFDKNGDEIARKDFEYIKSNDQEVIKVSEDKFCLVSGVKFKKPGLLLECFDVTLKSLWKLEKFNDETKYFPELSAVSESGNIAIFYREKMKAHYLLTVDQSGNEIANTMVNEEGITKFSPYRLQFLSNEEIILVSDYGTNGADLLKALPTGTNLKKFNLKGEEVQNQNLAFSELHDKLGDRTDAGRFLLPTSPVLRVLDITFVNGKQTLICESFLVSESVVSVASSTPGGTPTKVTTSIMSLLDLYLIDVSDISQAKRIWKPTRSVSISGVSTTFTIDEFCTIMEDNKMFSYQFTDNNALLIRNVGQNYEYFNHIPFTNNYDQLASRTYFGTVANEDLRIRGNQQKFYKDGINKARSMNYNGFMKTDETVLLYHMHKPTGELQFTVLKQN